MKIAGKKVERKRPRQFVRDFIPYKALHRSYFLLVKHIAVKLPTTATKDHEVVAVGYTDSLIICKH